ncbi:MAG: 2Fe-2S iron-sulfur cluster-binding protein [Gammaproteobacteria bacterium]
MTHHVTLLPSQHQFLVESTDTLLDAALRSGIAVDYGCSNGSCGACKVKLESGEIKRVRHHDYALREAQRSGGYFLLCAYTAACDLVLETVEAESSADIPWQEITARLKKIEELADDIALLRVQTPRTDRLRFLAGQQIELELGNGIARTYPIASCPCDDRNIEFHIRRVADEPFSEHAFSGLRKGDAITLRGPSGRFCLDHESSRPLVFIAFDTGFAPVKSLIEEAINIDFDQSIHLYWLAADSADRYLHNLARSWSDAFGNIVYRPLTVSHTSREEVERALSTVKPDFRESDVYIAGPEPAIKLAEQFCLRHGATTERLLTQATP